MRYEGEVLEFTKEAFVFCVCWPPIYHFEMVSIVRTEVAGTAMHRYVSAVIAVLLSDK
jgi:hypothetical protein